MSPYANELATARLNALRTLIDALNEADTPDEKRRCAVAIFNAPDPCDLDDEIELVDEDEDEDEVAEEHDDSDDDTDDTSATNHSESDSDPRDNLDLQTPALTSDLQHRPSDIPATSNLSYTPP